MRVGDATDGRRRRRRPPLSHSHSVIYDASTSASVIDSSLRRMKSLTSADANSHLRKIADCCWYRVENSDTAARKLSPPLLLRRCRLRPITKMLRRENLPNYYDLSPNSLHGFRLLLSELIASRAKTFESSHSLSEYKL